MSPTPTRFQAADRSLFPGAPAAGATATAGGLKAPKCPLLDLQARRLKSGLGWGALVRQHLEKICSVPFPELLALPAVLGLPWFVDASLQPLPRLHVACSLCLGVFSS